MQDYIVNIPEDETDSLSSTPPPRQSRLSEFFKQNVVQQILYPFQWLRTTFSNHPLHFLSFPCTDAAGVLRHIENHLIKEENGSQNGDVPVKMKEQFLDDCTMNAVASAITAQIAITALSLDNLNQVWWTVEAAFIICLVTAAFSVFFAARLQQKMSNLLSPTDIRDFLTTQADVNIIKQIEKFNDSLRKLRDQEREICEEERDPRMATVVKLIDELGNKGRWHKGSISAAMMLKVPALLLNCSISALILGFGLYLLDVSSYNLDRPNFGRSTGIVFRFYVGFASAGALVYMFPWLMKQRELNKAESWAKHDRKGYTCGVWGQDSLRARVVHSVDEPRENCKRLIRDIRSNYAQKRERGQYAPTEQYEPPSYNQTRPERKQQHGYH